MIFSSCSSELDHKKDIFGMTSSMLHGAGLASMAFKNHPELVATDGPRKLTRRR